MDSKKTGWVYATILVVGFIIYLPSLFFGFTYFDDNELILNNLAFLINLSNIPAAFVRDVFNVSNFSAFYYRPLLTISFMVDAQVSGTNPFFYHLTNILIHLAVGCLIFLLLTTLKYRRDLSFLASLVFVVHPVLTQAVSWIPGRNDSLLAVFLLSSFLFFLNYQEEKKTKDYFWHLTFFLLATLTKESAIFFPIVLSIFSFKHWKVFLPGWFGVLTTWFLARTLALSNPSPIDLSYALKSIVQNLPSVLLYIGKVFLPVNLSVLPILKDSNLIYGLLSLGVILILLVLSKNLRVRMLFFGAAWFLIFLLPNFVRPNPQTASDFLEHRIYLPFLGLIIIILEINLIKRLNFDDNKTKIAIGLVVSLLGITTIVYSRNFADRLSFWTSAVATSPHHPLAHRNLGAMYFLDGRLNEAEEEFIKSLELNPEEPMAHNNLGLVYMNKVLFDKAEEEFRKELKINPYYDNAYFNFGLLYYKRKMFNEAEGMWQAALRLNPDNQDAKNSLIILRTEKIQ